MAFTPGSMTPPLAGDITTLNAIPLASPGDIERNLGYGPGRLVQGFLLLVLKTRPADHHFELSGTTLRSGGKLGLPGQTAAADALRTRVQDQIVAERGAAGYAGLKSGAAGRAEITGVRRLVKVLPTIRHDAAAAPNRQYPMGGGFLQWTLKQPGLPFLVAAEFDGQGKVSYVGTGGAIVSADLSSDYGARQALQRSLQQA